MENHSKLKSQMATSATHINFSDEAKEVLLERYLDLKFVDDVTELSCKRCKRVLIHHYVANCGHLFCRNCQRILSFGEGWRCPECKEYITHIERQEVEVERRVNELMLHCPNHKYGCKFIDSIRHIPEHLADCRETRDASLPALLDETNSNVHVLEKISELSQQLLRLSENYDGIHQLRASDDIRHQQINNKLEEIEISIKDIRLEKAKLQSEVGDNWLRVKEMEREANELSVKLLSVEMQQGEVKESLMQKLIELDDNRRKDFQIKLDQLSEEMKNELRQSLDEMKRTIIQLTNEKRKLTALDKAEDHHATQESKLNRLTNDSQMTEYNIVLLGESGAGKSLIINSIPIYLQHNTLVEAIESSDPIPCLIPVSFTVTNDDFEIINIEYGGNSDNNRLVQGDSGTKCCTSYEFRCNNSIIRLIDSPGVSQGKAHDKFNIELILETINNYKDIHAIAIVLKSDQTKHTAHLKSCIYHILTQLNSSARLKLIFLLTHAESNDYKPGSIVPIIKTFIEQLKTRLGPELDMTVDKNNVFCVDNKWFRYLVARIRGVYDSEDPGSSYVTSYDHSANEFGRMLRHVTSGHDSPGQSHNTMTIYEARQFIKIVNPFLKVIIDEIEKHKTSRKQDVQDKEQRYRYVEPDASSPVEYEWYCTSEICRKHIVVNENEIISYFPRICSDASQLSWTLLNKCSICGCKAVKHRKMSSVTKIKDIDNIETSKQSDVKSSTKSNVSSNQLADKKRKIQQESDFIRSVIAVFDQFNIAHAIVLADEDNWDITQCPTDTELHLKLEEIDVYKTKLFQLEIFGPKIKYTFDWKTNDRKSKLDTSSIRTTNIFNLDQRFPHLKFC